jgi:hypothetical protein
VCNYSVPCPDLTCRFVFQRCSGLAGRVCRRVDDCRAPELGRKAADASVDGVGQLTGGLGGPPRYPRPDLGGPRAPRPGLGHPEGCIYSGQWHDQRVLPWLVRPGRESEELVRHAGRAMRRVMARQCSRNKCLAPVTVWIPHGGRGGGAGRVNSKKDLVTGPIRGFCALQAFRSSCGPPWLEPSGNPSTVVQQQRPEAHLAEQRVVRAGIGVSRG